MKKRVCAYARVSTNSRSQEHSFAFQSNYWNEKLGSNQDYEFVGLYADKGISGSKASKRPQFLQMVEAVKTGKVDLVFCKSVQRFARNTEDLLNYVRMFRELGVGVVFEKENINTLTNTDDLYLTIAAAIAEDDLSRYSQNVKWAVKDKFRKGECIIAGRLYGYRMGANETKFEIIEDEASVVRRIYNLYIDGINVNKIVEILNDEGIASPNGYKWHRSSIDYILRNEKYIGDALSQKFVQTNNVRVKNRGELDQYYVENHHEGVIDRDTWEKAQTRLDERSNKTLVGTKQKTYPFTGLIKCGSCGGSYHHKVNNSAYTPKFDLWECPSKKDVCLSVRIKDDELKDMFIDVFNEFVSKRYKGNEEEVILDKLKELEKEQTELIRLNANGWIPYANYLKEYDELNKRIFDVKEELNDYKNKNITSSDLKPIDFFEEDKVEKFLKGITIKGLDVTFEFYNGVKLTRVIQRTRVYEKDRRRIENEIFTQE